MKAKKHDPDPLYYAGRRIRKGKLVHLFSRDTAGEECYSFTKARQGRFTGAVIGAQYDLGGGLPFVWSQVKIGEAPEHVALEWQVQDRAAYQEHEDKKAERAPKLMGAVMAIRAARMTLTPAQRARFDAWLLNQIR